jgi:hypothetical protein
VIDVDVLDARLRRLDPAARAAVVADCWAAAGDDVAREGTTVRVRRDGCERTLSTVADPAADRVLGVADVRAALLYRVDRPAADRVARAHLGAPLAEVRPPLRRRAASVARGLATPAAALVAVALLVLVAVAGVGVGDEPTPAANESATVGTEAGPFGGSPPGAPPRNVTAPGLGPEGVTDIDRLAAAHERARPASYEVWVDAERPASNGDVVRRDVDVRVDGERYLAEVRVERGETVLSRDAVYGDGTDRYAASIRNGTVTTRTLPAEATGPAGVDPAALGAAGVRDWLAANETRVVRAVRDEERTAYRVVGTGVPEVARGTVESYRVEAWVRADGFVVDLTVEYVVVGPRQPRRAFEWSYGDDAATVTRPNWVDGNASAVGARETD